MVGTYKWGIPWFSFGVCSAANWPQELSLCTVMISYCFSVFLVKDSLECYLRKGEFPYNVVCVLMTKNSTAGIAICTSTPGTRLGCPDVFCI